MAWSAVMVGVRGRRLCDPPNTIQQPPLSGPSWAIVRTAPPAITSSPASSPSLILYYCFLLSQYRGISVMLVWVLAICLIYNFITSKTAFGRYFYAVGGNEKATQLSGINTNKIYFVAYANMGLLAGLCGLLNAARVGSVNGSTGTSFEMDAIGACFIGGASAYGGSGTVGGVVIGALLLGVINMGMSIMGIGDSWQYVVKGGVLLIAVIFDVVTSRKSGKGN